MFFNHILVYLVLFISCAEFAWANVSAELQNSEDVTSEIGGQVISESHKSYQVRVLLADLAQPETKCIIASEKGFLLSESLHEESKMRSSQKQLEISFRDGFFYLNGKRLRKQTCVIKPREGLLSFANNFYQGSFIIITDGTNAYLINSLDIEDYVFCVLKSEGWPGWPLEMNKVLAIACRTYVMAMIKEARDSKRPYHVKNTNVHQTYKGSHTQNSLKKAVDDTNGLFLAFEGKPILAMFDICCGGVVPAYIEGFDFNKAPYLARDYACTHCKTCSSYSWQVSFDKKELLTHLQKEFPHITLCKDVKITKKDKAGLVLEAQVKDVRTALPLSGRKLYSLFKDIKSYCFAVQKKGNNFIFKGRGFGHHLGLCQWGARAMVRDGWNYKSILSFYYPQTKLMRLT